MSALYFRGQPGYPLIAKILVVVKTSVMGIVDKFFETLRQGHWIRTEQRWLGGVCGAISMRTGIDIALIRGVCVFLSLFFSLWCLMPLAYALAWLLLPNERGQILAQDILSGHIRSQHLGALGLLALSCICSGVGAFGAWALGWFGLFAALVNLIVICGIVALLVAVSKNPPSYYPMPGAGSATSPAKSPAATQFPVSPQFSPQSEANSFSTSSESTSRESVSPESTTPVSVSPNPAATASVSPEPAATMSVPPGPAATASVSPEPVSSDSASSNSTPSESATSVSTPSESIASDRVEETHSPDSQKTPEEKAKQNELATPTPINTQPSPATQFPSRPIPQQSMHTNFGLPQNYAPGMTLPPYLAPPIQPIQPFTRHVLSPVVGLITLGVLALGLAVICFIRISMGFPLISPTFFLYYAAFSAIILGSELTYAALRGKQGGWLTTLTILLAIFSFPVILLCTLWVVDDARYQTQTLENTEEVNIAQIYHNNNNENSAIT